MKKSIIFLFFVLSGCDPVAIDAQKDQANASSDGPSEIHPQDLGSFIQVKVTGADPEKYLVYFSWPKLNESRSIRVRQNSVLQTISSNQTFFSHTVDHDQTLTYSFEVLDAASRVEKSFSKLVKVPRDYVVRENQFQFFEDTQLTVNRVFLRPNVPLRTNGHKLEIITSELKSDDGWIESFPDSAKASLDTDGRSAGELTLKIASATGRLRIYMRGENGGDGSNAPPHSNRAQDGGRAGQGEIRCRCIGVSCGNKQKQNPVLYGATLQPQMERCYCVGNPSPGGDGSNGAKGFKGNPARNGGNTGTLKISVNDGREFTLQEFSIVGRAGIPGRGGAGQLGGLGGDGRIIPSEPGDCRGLHGNDGHQGPPGDPGAPGQDGKIGPVCKYIASENINECSQ